jgi:hypothetical protein
VSLRVSRAAQWGDTDNLNMEFRKANRAAGINTKSTILANDNEFDANGSKVIDNNSDTET